MNIHVRVCAILCLSCLLLTATVGLSQPATQSSITAVPVADFLNSIGVNSSVERRGETLDKTIECAKYMGFRWIRSGIENDPNLKDLIELHNQTGVRFSWCIGSAGSDIDKLLSTAREMAAADALLAFEGPNEPNNWGITYQGEEGGGKKSHSWMAVAKLQRDLYAAVKSDPLLKKYPVWGISENGAETDNVGLQFLVIPKGANTLMPDGTKYADFACVHNYTYHQNSPKPADNKTWDASDPTKACKVDGLYGEYGVTWLKKFQGYSETELLTLPRVTTETGTTVSEKVPEEMHALNLMSTYLDQFKRGWSFTAVYILRDRSDESGNQGFGFYKPDYTPRKAAVYIHNLTTILADNGSIKTPGTVKYSIPNQPATVHDMLLQKSDGTFELVVWDERLSGSDEVTVNLGGTYDTVNLYDPTVGTTPTKTLTKIDSVPLTLSNRPVIIEIPKK